MKFITTTILLVVSFSSLAGENTKLYDLSNTQIRQEFRAISKIDGKFGITHDELLGSLGESDAINTETPWEGGKKYIYRLSNNRELQVVLLNDNVVQGVIANSDGTVYLVWK